MARTPSRPASDANIGHRWVLMGAVKSPTRIGLPESSASIPGPSHRVACNSSTSPARESVTYNGSEDCMLPVNIRQAPLMPNAWRTLDTRESATWMSLHAARTTRLMPKPGVHDYRSRTTACRQGVSAPYGRPSVRIRRSLLHNGRAPQSRTYRTNHLTTCLCELCAPLSRGRRALSIPG